MPSIFLVLFFFVGDSILLAKGDANQQKAEELIREAEQFEKLGTILAVAGITLMVLSIPLAIYWDRRKKRKKRSAQREAEGKGPTSPI